MLPPPPPPPPPKRSLTQGVLARFAPILRLVSPSKTCRRVSFHIGRVLVVTESVCVWFGWRVLWVLQSGMGRGTCKRRGLGRRAMRSGGSASLVASRPSQQIQTHKRADCNGGKWEEGGGGAGVHDWRWQTTNSSSPVLVRQG